MVGMVGAREGQKTEDKTAGSRQSRNEDHPSPGQVNRGISSKALEIYWGFELLATSTPNSRLLTQKLRECPKPISWLGCPALIASRHSQLHRATRRIPSLLEGLANDKRNCRACRDINHLSGPPHPHPSYSLQRGCRGVAVPVRPVRIMVCSGGWRVGSGMGQTGPAATSVVYSWGSCHVGSGAHEDRCSGCPWSVLRQLQSGLWRARDVLLYRLLGGLV